MENLPHDILVHILFRLPVESLVRLKCSCKLWYKLISDPQFIQMHLTHVIRNLGYLYSFYDHLDRYRYYMESEADHTEAMKISWGGVENMREYSIFDNGYSSAGGLISYYADDHKSIIIWNPATGEKVKVPKDPYKIGLEDFVVIRHGLGYSLSTGEHKLLVFGFPSIDNIHGVDPRGGVYTRCSYEWRQVKHVPLELKPRSSVIHSDGALLWEVFESEVFVYEDYENALPFPEETINIGVFDFVSEEFQAWCGPCPTEFHRSDTNHLLNFRDMIACVCYNGWSHDLWFLRDKKKQVWNKEYMFIEKHICTFDSRLFTKEVQFLGIWLHDDHLFGKDWHSDCVAYDCKSKEYRVITLPFGNGRYALNIFSHAGSLIFPTRIVAEAKKLLAG